MSPFVNNRRHMPVCIDQCLCLSFHSDYIMFFRFVPSFACLWEYLFVECPLYFTYFTLVYLIYVCLLFFSLSNYYVHPIKCLQQLFSPTFLSLCTCVCFMSHYCLKLKLVFLEEIIICHFFKRSFSNLTVSSKHLLDLNI
jgi:hypothetical protein